MMRKPVLFVIVLFAMGLQVLSQGIRGEIRDREGEPVPFAAIFIKELKRGTTCNGLGLFSLPLPEGTYSIIFRSLGYTEVSKTVEVGPEYSELTITLPPQTYMIPEVRVSASGEDPAYWIMRKTIGLANYHLHEVSNYNAEIYIKGSAIIDKIPKVLAKRIEVNDFKVEEDQAYMLESLNEVKFTAPDQYDMRVIASQNTLPGFSENVNPMDYVNASLYQEQIETVVSPLARNAFSHYKFSFEGTFMEGTYVVSKIKVTPKRKSQQLVEGYLYIVEDIWCLHSSDLSVKTIAGTLYLQQLYSNVIMDAWLPVSHKLQIDVQIAGVKGSVTYVSSLEYSEVTLNPNLPEAYFTPINETKQDPDAESEEEVAKSKEQEKINELLKKEELSNRDMAKLSKLMQKEAEGSEPQEENMDLNQTGTQFTVDEDAVKNDSLYWNKVRPIPLTPEETITLRARDSIIGIQQAVTATDSVTPAKKKSKWVNNLLFGKTYLRDRGQFRFTYEGLLDLEMLDYNTVDGLSYGQDARINWKLDSIHTLRSRMTASYAFHRGAPLLMWETDYLYAPLRRGKVALHFNYGSRDFSGSTGMPKVTNMFYTLLYRENHLKMYEQLDVMLYNRIDIKNGLVLTTSATYGEKRQLQNNTDFSFFYTNQKEFTDNTPRDLPIDDPSLQNQQFFNALVRLDYTPKHFFRIRNYRKEMRKSNWPTFSLQYKQAFPLEQTGWSDFGQLQAAIYQNTELGLMSKLRWSLESGLFFRDESIHFSDFRHFKSGPLILDMAGFDDAFMLMDYYEASTSEHWFRGDVKLTSSYLLIKFLPWFSERLWTESLSAAYLYTPAIPHYMQVGYSLNEIFFLVDLGVYVGFQDWGYKGFGARVNFRF